MLDKLRIAISAVALLAALLLSDGHAFATQAHSVDLFEFDTPKQQKQAIELAKTLRCQCAKIKTLSSPILLWQRIFDCEYLSW